MTSAEIECFIKESKEYLLKGDAIQASEKLYKAVEECLKVLAQKHRLPEYIQAEKEGQWRSYLLGQAARRLARELQQKEIGYAWSKAFEIHVWGFHEAKYGVEDIEEDIPYVEWLLDFVKKQEK